MKQILVLILMLFGLTASAQTTPTPSQNFGNFSFYTNYQGLGLYWLGHRFIDVRDSTKLQLSLRTHVRDTTDDIVNAMVPNMSFNSSQISDLNTAVSNWATSNLESVAFDGQYSSLDGLPSLFNGQYNSLTDIPSTFSPSPHTHDLVRVQDSINVQGSNVKIFSGVGYPDALGTVMLATNFKIQFDRGDGIILKDSVTIDKTVIGLSNVDNTADINKPISNAQAAVNATKFNTPSGNSSQYLNGAGTPTTFPVIPTIKRDTTYTSTTDGSGNYTVVYGTAYSTRPVVIPILPNNSSTLIDCIVTNTTTNGFTVNVFQRGQVTSLPLIGSLLGGVGALLGVSTTPVSGATIDVNVKEK